MDDSIWDVTVFSKNRERLLDGDIAEAFFQAVLQQARERSPLSDEHFTVVVSSRLSACRPGGLAYRSLVKEPCTVLFCAV
jgi:hypothetical protein